MCFFCSRLEVLKALSDDGKDLLYFEEDAGKLKIKNDWNKVRQL